MKEKRTKIKPCPFCGNTTVTIYDYSRIALDEKRAFYGEHYCEKDKNFKKVMFWGSTWKKVYKNWNKRYEK